MAAGGVHNPAGKVSAPALFTEDLPGSQSLQERLLVAENASQLPPNRCGREQRRCNDGLEFELLGQLAKVGCQLRQLSGGYRRLVRAF